MVTKTMKRNLVYGLIIGATAWIAVGCSQQQTPPATTETPASTDTTVSATPAPAQNNTTTVEVGTPPPAPAKLRRTAPPPPEYADFYSNAVLNLGDAYFGLDYATVDGYHRNYHLTQNELIYILYLAHYSHRPVPFVIQVYKKYHRRGWEVMAQQLGLTGDYPGWFRDSDADSVAPLYLTSDYYDVPYPQIQVIYNQGYRPEEIVVAVNVATRSGQPVSGILTERNKGTSWENIATQNKTSIDEIKAPQQGRGKTVTFGAPLTGTTPTSATENKTTSGNGQKPTSMSTPTASSKTPTSISGSKTNQGTSSQALSGNGQKSTAKPTPSSTSKTPTSTSGTKTNQGTSSQSPSGNGQKSTAKPTPTSTSKTPTSTSGTKTNQGTSNQATSGSGQKSTAKPTPTATSKAPTSISGSKTNQGSSSQTPSGNGQKSTAKPTPTATSKTPTSTSGSKTSQGTSKQPPSGYGQKTTKPASNSSGHSTDTVNRK